MKGGIGPRQQRRYHGHGTGGHQTRQSGTLVTWTGPSSLGGIPKADVAPGNIASMGGKAREGATHRRGSMANGSGLELVGAVCMPRQTEGPRMDAKSACPVLVAGAKMQVEEGRLAITKSS
jgi:hypothetical protein